MTTSPITVSRHSDLSTPEYQDYKWGFVTEVDTDLAPKGLNDDIVRLISAKKREPEWLLEWRLKALHYWQDLSEKEGDPEWAMISYPPIDYQDSYYYAAPRGQEDRPKSLGRGRSGDARGLRKAWRAAARA